MVHSSVALGVQNFDLTILSFILKLSVLTRGHPWYSGIALDCWPTGRAIDPAPGARFVTKFVSFAGPV